MRQSTKSDTHRRERKESLILVQSRQRRDDSTIPLRPAATNRTAVRVRKKNIAWQYNFCELHHAQNGEIVVALIKNEEATVKRFFLRKDYIELRPENNAHPLMRHAFGEVLIQGKVIGVQRGPEQLS